MEQVNLDQTPAIYEFQGHALKYGGDDVAKLVGKGTTWRNGTIMLTDKQMFMIASKNVVLQNMTVIGGKHGVQVTGEGEVIMTDCEVRDAYFAIIAGASGSLVATRVKVMRGTIGIDVTQNGNATFFDCDISVSKQTIQMLNSGSMNGTRSKFTSTQDQVISLHGDTKLTLKDCTLVGELGAIYGPSSVVLSGCTMTGKFYKQHESATVKISP